MDKRLVLAAALSMFILIAWSAFVERPAPRRPPEPTTVPATTQADPTTSSPSPPVLQADPLVEAAVVEAAAVEEILVETDLFEVVLTNQGARALSWKLKDYTTADDQPLELVPSFTDGETRMLAVQVLDPTLSALLGEALFSIERTPLAANSGSGAGEKIRFAWADGRGRQVVKTLTFRNGEYLVGVELDVSDRGSRLPARMELGPGLGAQESVENRSNYYYAGQALWNRGGKVSRTKRKKLDEPGSVSGDLLWAGLEDQYFAAIIVPGEGPADVAWRSVELTERVVHGDDQSEVDALDQPVLSVSIAEGGGLLYVGPKKYTLLRDLGPGLELGKAVWFSSNELLGWIARFIFLCLIWIYEHTIQNYGLAIIASTFLLRVLLFPVNQYSMVKMKKTQLQMQKLQPKIKGIKNKYKKAKDAESRGKMNQEMMELYRKEGVNPMGGLSGCLPLLAQFPILIGFYNMLTVAVELRGAPFFGWIRDLSQSDPLWIIPLLMGGTMFLQQRMAMNKVTDPVQQQQQKFMMIMPVMFTWICLQMPSGMVLYWFVNNVLGIGQQWLVNRHTSKLEAASQRA